MVLLSALRLTAMMNSKFAAGEKLFEEIWVQGLDDTLHKFNPWLPQAHRNCKFRRAQLAIDNTWCKEAMQKDMSGEDEYGDPRHGSSEAVILKACCRSFPK